jgi:hypothetical protein
MHGLLCLQIHKIGGACRIRTDVNGFADRLLASWITRHISIKQYL